MQSTRHIFPTVVRVFFNSSCRIDWTAHRFMDILVHAPHGQVPPATHHDPHHVFARAFSRHHGYSPNTARSISARKSRHDKSETIPLTNRFVVELCAHALPVSDVSALTIAGTTSLDGTKKRPKSDATTCDASGASSSSLGPL